MVTIGGHLQIHRACGSAARRIPQAEAHSALLLQGTKQQLHQGLMLQDPAHRSGVGLGAVPRQIRSEKRHLPPQGAITELQPAEGRQMGAQRLPEIQAGQQLGAGMGEGVGAAAVEQPLAGLWIAELHLPAAAG